MGIEVDLSYPSLEGLEKDFKSAEIISRAYCDNYGELTAILQYGYHGYYFDEVDGETAKILREISVAEMHHFNILGKTLLKLGVDPVYTKVPPYRCNFYNSFNISYSKTPYKMLLDDINGEIRGIDCYEEIISELNNEQVSAIISRILLDEQLHVKVLKERLKAISKKD